MTEQIIEPQAGPQTAFAQCRADVAIYGGAAGGGKSWSLLFEALRWHQVPGFRAVIFRKALTDITVPGGLWDASRDMYPQTGAEPRGSPVLDWRWPSDARVGFSYLDKDGDELRHQGAEYAVELFDEGTHIRERHFWYLQSRNRSRCGVRPYTRISCNPDPDSFIRQLIDWWIGPDGLAIPERSGVLRWFVRGPDGMLQWADTREELGESARSLTFIPSRLEDNPALTSTDPGYRARLESLPRIDRERLLGANWDVKPIAGSFFQRSWIDVLEAPPRAALSVRTWDLAATAPTEKSPDPDWTVGTKVVRARDGRLVVEHAERMREGPGTVEAAMRRIAEQDGKHVRIGLWQDPGGAGKAHVAHLVKTVLKGFSCEVIVAAKNKQAYAKPISAAADPAVDPGPQLAIVAGPWNTWFLSQLEGFPEGKHDDAVDALSLAGLLLTGKASARSRAAAMAS